MEAQIFYSGFTPCTQYRHVTTIGHCKTPSFNKPTSVNVKASRHGFVEARRGVSLCCRKSGWGRMRVQCRKESLMLREDVGKGGVGDLGMNVGRKKLAVFVSGGGSNFRAIHEATVDGEVNGDVVLVVTNKEGCGGAQYARDRGIPVYLFPRSKGEPDEIALIPLEMTRAYPRCIINIHPSLLPSFGGKGFYGMKVHEQVIASGARCSGATIHFVNEEYGKGKILAQRVVPVLASDSPEDLAARVLKERWLQQCARTELSEGRMAYLSFEVG
ncbi:Phosphoribosylglycinamide formyltransferase, chloroplastic-like protein [Drosera capensis]